MNALQALLLGLIQGLTEFLPVSSSGHLEIGKVLLGVEPTDDLLFTTVVHAATVLATIVVFRTQLAQLFKGLFRLHLNEETRYILKICVSMIPILIVGVFFKDTVESFFGNGLLLVGSMLLVTALLLALATWLGSGKREIDFKDALIIGLAQSVAVLPGLSRSGTTIATGLLLGNKKEAVAQFSFLMVLVPILGELCLDIVKGDLFASQIPFTSLLIGFIAAFLSGWFACRFMLRIVKKGKLVYFAAYCVIIGLLAIFL